MNDEHVVKCGNEQCGLYFGYSSESSACPFCRVVYGATKEKIEDKPKEKKGILKNQKESFKMWKDN